MPQITLPSRLIVISIFTLYLLQSYEKRVSTLTSSTPQGMLKDYFARPFTLDRIGKILSILAIIALVWWIVGSLYSLIVPFALAWVTAQLLMPVVQFVQHRLRVGNRSISILLVLLVFFSVISGVIALLVPSIQEEGKKAWELLTFYATPELFLNIIPETYRAEVADFFEREKLFANMDMQEVLNYLQQIFTQGWNVVSSTFNFLMGFAVVGAYLIYLFFILSDYEALNRGLLHLFPAKARPLATEIGENIDKYVNSYFKGQGLIALCVGVFMATGFYIMGMPLGITCGLFIGVLNLVPYLQILGIPPMIILCLLQSASSGQNVWVLFVIAFAILGVCQLMQDLYLTPRIMGRQMGMSPAIILFSLTIWGKIGGMLGLFFGLPITMILYTLYMKYVIGEPIEEGNVVRVSRPPSWTKYLRKKHNNPAKTEE